MTDVNEGDNEDKKVIADEEREKMLNKENENVIIKEANNKIEEIDKIDKEKELEKEKEAEGDVEKETEVLKAGEVEKRKKQLEESQKESKIGSIRVPIGGIKMPGFLRSLSRDKNKETDGTTEEGLDLLESGGQKAEKPEKPEGGGFRGTLVRGIDNLKARSPFAKKDASQANGETVDANGAETPRPRPLLERIKLPSVTAVLPKRFARNKDQTNLEDPAVSEPLDGEKPASPDGDGMESVKLDGDDDANKDVEKAGGDEGPKKPIHLQLIERAQQLTRHEKLVVGLVILLLLILIIVLSATLGGPIPTAPPVIDGKVVTTTQCGPVEGRQEGEAFAFLGIPFAVPPVNKQRWRPAQELTNLSYCWPESLFLAHNESTKRHCWQETDGGNIDGFEDCLYLDVWTPEVRYINPVPVVVLIDVPTLRGGPLDILRPDSHIVKTKEIVFVRPNFRVGVFGFLAATPLRQSVHPPTSGNYGLSDILAALKWVQTNIAHFGGDPEQVTLVGHRAGGTLVTALATSPKSKDLFKRVWSSSGSAMFPGEPVETAEEKGQTFVKRLCEDIVNTSNGDMSLQLDCLLKKDVESIMDAASDIWPQPPRGLPAKTEDVSAIHDWLVLDGKILLNHTWSELKERKTAMVVGTTAQVEATEALRKEMKDVDGEITEDDVVREVRNSGLGNLAEEALSKYNTTRKGFFSMISDIRTICPLLIMSRTENNITFYVVTQSRSPSNASLADVGLDMQAVTGQYRPDSIPQRAFVTTMQDFFYKYVIDGILPPLPSPAPTQPVLTISQTAEWRSEYPNCAYWAAKQIVPVYSRRD